MRKTPFLMGWIFGALAIGALAESAQDFSYHGKPIHPGLVCQFLTPLADKGAPFVTSVDIAAAFDTNEYFIDDVRKDERGAVLCENAADKSIDGYRWFGRMGDGNHVVLAWHDDGSRLFPSSLFFFRMTPGQGFTNEGARYDRLLMTVTRWYAPCSLTSAVTVAADTVTITPADGADPVVLQAIKDSASASPPVLDALKEADQRFFCAGKPIHPGLVRLFIGSLADKGYPITVGVDVAAAAPSNRFFSDDVKESEKGLYTVAFPEGEGFCAYRHCGRMADGTHIVHTFLNEGGSGVFQTLYFVRFSCDQAYGPEGKPYGRLVMTADRWYSLSADGEPRTVSVAPDRVVLRAADGTETPVPPVAGTAAAPPATDAPRKATVKADALRVRAKPSLEAEVVAKVPSGASVDVLESPADAAPWMRIQVPGTKDTGWVHGDYLILEAASAPSDSASAMRFVRVSIWKGDPNTEWLADLGKPEERKFYGVHGAFPVGTKFTVLAQEDPKTYAATAKRTIHVNLEIGSQFDVTELSFETEGYQTAPLFLAVVGGEAAYQPIAKTPIQDSAILADLAARTGRDIPDFKKLPYDYEGSGFAAADTKTAAYSLAFSEGPASLITFRTPYKSEEPLDLTCETAVLFWSGRPFVCSPDGGPSPLFFRLGGKEYCWQDFRSCNSGACTAELYARNGAEFVSIYSNDDFGS